MGIIGQASRKLTPWTRNYDVTVRARPRQRCRRITSPTPRPSLNSISGIRELDEVRFWLRAGGEQLAMHPGKGLRGTVIRAQSEDQASTLGDEPSGPIDQLLEHRLQAPALGRMPSKVLNFGAQAGRCGGLPRPVRPPV
jgi:hypothetical protein